MTVAVEHIRALPKVELHVHVEGAAPPLTIALYYLLHALDPRAGPYALLVPFWLIVIGARRFQRMHNARIAANPA